MTSRPSQPENFLKKLSNHTNEDKTKFFQILKSIFAVFDPDCTGSIDINELDVLGVDNNEIFNEVLNYVRSYKVLKPVNHNLGSRKFLVKFEELVKASEVVLDQRKQNSSNGHTLSQAFEPHGQNSSLNTLDLISLIDKENYLLRQGLDSIDSLKQWYTTQLIENKIKQNNLNKLKYQNLFSIDKLLIDLRQLNDFNLALSDFLVKKKIESSSGDSFSEPPNYEDYMQQFGIHGLKRDIDLDNYLKEKQERIDSLQKEKSSLIRKLFEIKSESENINKNMLKLNHVENASEQHSTSLSHREKEIPIIIDKSFNQKHVFKPENFTLKFDKKKFARPEYL
ncbi:hypothetical protein BpHYR1_019831 [Brachionus plicatilis]|uniref:EF-hand domain-containing protein n=1 Tax=Brachionus plicatilis TaxID=10195 RepID=A0A3M7QQA8_BRAPC|nr:hypothetical protein BpHYR1_019831 [Brachionus plicatilis]